uniref:hypothetical protein n=1 Tax=Flavobacterium sp. TaxID=239 RepID=UPI004049E0E1
MKKIVLLFVLFQSSFMVSQYYMNDGFYFVNKPNLDNAIDFYINNYEFNPADLAIPLVEIEKQAQQNQNPSIKYFINKLDNKLTKVIVKVNDLLFSESFYTNGLLEGKKTIYNGKGAVFHEINYVKGKANGTYKMYSDFDDLLLETEFKNNQKHGKRTLYSKKSRVMTTEGIYENGILVSDLTLYDNYQKFIIPKNATKGKVKQYTKENVLVSEFELIGNGMLHGMAIVYNLSNQKPYSKVSYTYGKMNGIAEFYSKNGNLLTKNEYKNGQKVGKHQYFYENDQLKLEEFYDEFGNPTGIWKGYRYDGKNNYTKQHLPNNVSIYTTFDTNETINSITTYTDKFNINYTTKRYENGILSSETTYQNNKILSATVYYANGTIFSIETPKGHRYVKEFYNKEGKLIHTNQVSDEGKNVGVYKNAVLKNDEFYLNDEYHYDANGNKTKWVYKMRNGKMEYNYRNNTQHGPKITYDENDKITLVEYYFEINGKPKNVSKEEFENLTKAENK